MSDIAAKRAFVYNMYSGPGWHRKVEHMSDVQIVAIFLREQNKNTTSTEENTDDEDIPF